MILMLKSDFIDISFTAHFGVLKISDRKAIRSQARHIADALNRQYVFILGSDSVGWLLKQQASVVPILVKRSRLARLKCLKAAILKLIVFKQYDENM